MVAREQVMSALAALYAVPGPGVAMGLKLSGRRAEMLEKIGLDNQPALFFLEGDDDYLKEPKGNRRKLVMNIRLNLFARVSQDTAGAPTINTLLDTIEKALAPDGPGQPWNACTLNGLVNRVWIEGRARKVAGDVNGQAFASVPVKVLVP